MLYTTTKRALDITVAGAVLTAVAPLLGLAACGIFLEDGGPVFFRQTRIGKGGQPFSLLKLRSMKRNQISVEQMGQVTASNPLVLRVGKLLRRTKLDEIPQLLNVLRGEMALVGPRPTVEEQTKLYDQIENRRLRVKPGLTGWAQVNGNASLSWSDRIALDIWYVDHASIALDLRILVKTVAVVLFGERPNRSESEAANEYVAGTYRCG